MIRIVMWLIGWKRRRMIAVQGLYTHRAYYKSRRPRMPVYSEDLKRYWDKQNRLLSDGSEL